MSDPSAVPAALDPATVVVRVDDTTLALQRLAKHIRRASGAQVVAITGSAGKTTTKELTADLLEARYRVFRNHGNFNNHIGLPLSLLELRHRPEIAVVELGMNHAGEIRVLVDLAEPDVRVWTLVAEVHSAFFASMDAIADAKAEILDGATPRTLIVANAADPLVMARVRPTSSRVLTFGIDVAADVAATGVIDDGLSGTRATVATPSGPMTVVDVPLLGRGHLANALAAIAVAGEFGVPRDGMAARLAAARPAARRGEVWRLSVRGHARRRFVQLEPAGAAAHARRRGGRAPVHAPPGGARRDARTGRAGRRASRSGWPRSGRRRVVASGDRGRRAGAGHGRGGGGGGDDAVGGDTRRDE